MYAPSHLFLQIAGRGVSIHCDHLGALELVRENFAAMAVPSAHADLEYEVSHDGNAYQIQRPDNAVIGRAPDLGGLLYLLDSDLVVQLQLMRPDLLFLHGAVLTDVTGAHILTGRSGAGKSTTCWGLLHRNLGYLSDELAPIALSDLIVQPFPRALCLKTAPPPAYPLPPDTPVTSRGYHVPVSRLPSANGSPSPAAAPVRTVFFIEYAPGRTRPAVHPIGSAEAAARLYPNVLNALAHSDDGMAAVARVASGTRAFVVDAADLRATCDAIYALLPG